MRKLYTLLLAAVISASAIAQDIHFSQYFNAPLIFNPAMTGFTSGTYRAAINYRNQWFSATQQGFFKSPYMTTAASFDMPVKVKDNALGVGLYLAADQAGANTFSSIIVNASAAYLMTLGKNRNHRLSAGLQFGYHYQGVKSANFQFANQFQDNTFNGNLSNNEFITNNAVGYLNANLGLFWFGKFTDKVAMYAGGAFFNNMAAPRRFILPNGDHNFYYSRFNVAAGLDITIKQKFHLMPSGFYMRQGNNTQLNTGLGFGYDFSDDMKMTIGLHNRVHNLILGATSDAIIPYVGFEVKGFRIGLSYDATISQLKNSGSGIGAFELSLSYTGKRKDYNFKNALICPRF